MVLIIPWLGVQSPCRPLVILAGPFHLRTLCDPVDFSIWESYRWNTQLKHTAQFLSCQKDVAEIEVAQRKMSVMGMTGLQKCFHRKAGN